MSGGWRLGVGVLLIASTASAQRVSKDEDAPPPTPVVTPAPPPVVVDAPPMPSTPEPPPVPLPPSPPAESEPRPAAPRVYVWPTLSFEVDFKLATSLSILGPTGAVPSLLLGVRTDRLTVQLGVSIYHTSTTSSSGSSSTSDLLWTLAPTLTVDVLRSSTHRAALYLLAAGSFGQLSSSESSSGGTSNNTSNNVFGYQVAVGARALVTDGFTLGFEAGPAAIYSTSSSMDSVEDTYIYAAIVGSFFTTN